ncbi:hypothetical protein HYN59_06110 [Flavobacterium album]|uniref:Uncharacterized protein n=1 Tax=Flavobacterium album TaxID=2175091 RepID=A0A2S1QWC6_9FLAO|nr:hypothetical protein [Flavobacterium album]AWH84720.1 hypothetical protein HYN59_06110 [Flavobacterium album]
MERQNIAAHFPNGEVPELLVKFYKFPETIEFTDPEAERYIHRSTPEEWNHNLEAVIDSNVIGEFIPFYYNGIHETYCFWNIRKGENLTSQPVVHISKQQHHSVIAGNLGDFFSIHCLALDIKISYILVDNDHCIKEGMESYMQDPYKFCSPERCESISNDYAENHPDFLPFRKWMADEMGITPAEDPVKIVADAYNTLPNLIEYIRSKDGFKVQTIY